MVGNRYFGRPVTATTSTSGTIVNANFTNPEFVARPKLPLTTTALNVTAVGYFGYVGLWPAGAVFQHWEGQVTNVFSAELGDVGIFVSPLPPNRQTQNLFRIATATAKDSFLTTGVKRNTDAFNATLYTDSFMWAGIRQTGTGGQMTAVTMDLGDGYAMIDVTGTAFTATTNFIATLFTANAPYMALSLL